MLCLFFCDRRKKKRKKQVFGRFNPPLCWPVAVIVIYSLHDNAIFWCYYRVTSEVGHNYLQTYPKMRDAKSLMHMKEQMEWNSNVFKEGDYDGKGKRDCKVFIASNSSNVSLLTSFTTVHTSRPNAVMKWSYISRKWLTHACKRSIILSSVPHHTQPTYLISFLQFSWRNGDSVWCRLWKKTESFH